MKLRNRINGAASRVWDKGGELVVWGMCNKKKSRIIVLALVGAGLIASSMTNGEAAYAVPVIPILIGIAVVGGGLFAANQATDGIIDTIRGGVIGAMSWSQTLVVNTANGALLTNSFETLLGDQAIHDALYNLHHIAIIPLGNIIAAIFFVYGLVKLVSKAGQTEGGIDSWQLIFLFVMYGAAVTIINASWEIMYGMFQLSLAVIKKILVVSQTNLQMSDPTEGIENAGLLFAMLMASLIVMLVSVVVCALSHAVVIIRAIQIYIYTVFSPVPLAFMVSEGGRDMTKSFLKKYVALLISGAMLALLFYLFSLVITAVPFPDMQVTDMGTFAQWATLLVLNYIVFYGAFGYAVFKSGAWSRDLIGA